MKQTDVLQNATAVTDSVDTAAVSDDDSNSDTKPLPKPEFDNPVSD